MLLNLIVLRAYLHLHTYRNVYIMAVHIHMYNYICVLIVVAFTRPPEDTTACRGSEVIISCGHNSTTIFSTIWRINGSGFRSIVNDPLYLVENQTLTVFSINYTTTFQCSVNILQSPPIVLTSTTAMVTVVGMYKCICVCMYLLYTYIRT